MLDGFKALFNLNTWGYLWLSQRGRGQAFQRKADKLLLIKIPFCPLLWELFVRPIALVFLFCQVSTWCLSPHSTCQIPWRHNNADPVNNSSRKEKKNWDPLTIILSTFLLWWSVFKIDKWSVFIEIFTHVLTSYTLYIPTANKFCPYLSETFHKIEP